MSTTDRTLKAVASLAAVLAVVIALGGMWATPAGADDTDLFRAGFGKPYLFIFFDTSSSMNLTPPDQEPVPANGDDPTSTLYQAKKVFYEVFNDVYLQHGDVVHYGFGSYNKDGTKIKGKNWVYEVTGGSIDIGGTAYPSAGELLVLGRHFPFGVVGHEPTFGGGGPQGPTQGATIDDLVTTDDGVLGDCTNPADLADHRTHINRFPKLHPVAADPENLLAGAGSMMPTTLHISAGGTTYELVVSENDGLVGDASLTADFTLTPCGGDTSVTAQVTLTKVREFLYNEQVDDDQFDLKQAASVHEMTNGYWGYQAVDSTATCGGDHPLTGRGWEGNYDGYFVGDGGDPSAVNPISGATEEDSFGSTVCDVDPITRKVECNVKHETSVYDSSGEVCFDPEADEWRARDQGDLIAFDWENTNRGAFFRRLAPNWAEGDGLANLRFDVASYFTDVPAADGYLRLKNPSVKPLMPFGGSPIGDALLDWRCFYLGTDAGGSKCHQGNQPFGGGWDTLAAACDSEFGCRKVYQIIIGDGENNCSGENPAADTANLRRNRVQSWVINFGGPKNSDLERLARNTGGQYVPVENPDQLKEELERIAGIILEDVRQFASAAAPQIQADDNDKVFNASFQPVNDLTAITPTAGVWPGRMNSFLKPVPLNTDGTPDTSFDCSTDPTQAPRANCHLWDATEQTVLQSTGLGTAANERRVFYSMLDGTRRMLAPTSGDGAEAYDLWRGMGLIPDTMSDGGDSDANETQHEADANGALATLYAVKTFDPGTPGDNSDDLDFVLGDVFHSEPLVVDQPEGTTYFRRNLFSDPDADDCAAGNPGYRCFFLEHENRRKVMFFGANDGLLHALDAGIFRPEGHDFEFRYDDGTGREIFAYAPRTVLPTIYSSNSGGPRQWSVDASPNASDVFIDVVHAGTPDPDDREWRTVVMTGLRRGGIGYVALDVTQPDTYNTDGIPQPLAGSPDYVPSCIDDTSLPAECGEIAYGTALWEFTDSKLEPEDLALGTPDRLVPFDEDANGIPDLATSWSDPVLGLIRVCADDGGDCNPDDNPENIEVRSVAIFGGGFNNEGMAGDWLYIVDVETGQAIYKQPLCIGGTSGILCPSAGSAPAEPAVVDVDADGFIDRIYVGTRRGYMLRADLQDFAGNVPALTLVPTVTTTEAGVVAVDVPRIEGAAFIPREIFRAAAAGGTPAPSRQIFYRPAAGFLSNLGQYAVAFGTGDREELFTEDDQPGRFYVFRDDIDVGDTTTRYSETDLLVVTDGVTGALGIDTLTENSATQGWLLLTRLNDRLITTPFQVAGITVFTMFEPNVVVDGGDPGGGPTGSDPVCSRTGTSRVFAVNTRNADGLLFDAGTRIRGTDIAGFVVSPTLERAGTQNIYDPNDPSSGSIRPDTTPDDPSDDQNLLACEDSPDCMLTLAEMQKLQPDNCKYSAQRHNMPLTTDLLVKVDEIPIPICIIDKNWVEL